MLFYIIIVVIVVMILKKKGTNDDDYIEMDMYEVEMGGRKKGSLEMIHSP